MERSQRAPVNGRHGGEQQDRVRSTANLISPPPPLPNAPCFRRSPPVTLPARSPPVPAAVTVPARCRVGHRQSQCLLGDCSVPGPRWCRLGHRRCRLFGIQALYAVCICSAMSHQALRL